MTEICRPCTTPFICASMGCAESQEPRRDMAADANRYRVILAMGPSRFLGWYELKGRPAGDELEAALDVWLSWDPK
jgi:hypothetical protein